MNYVGAMVPAAMVPAAVAPTGKLLNAKNAFVTRAR